jgi:hypothetical protein
LEGEFVSPLTLCESADGFAPTCTLIGKGQRADLIWTQDEFVAVCYYMLNENPSTHFILVYRDDTGIPHFVRSKSARVGPRIEWAWKTVTGRAKKKSGIGFYPCSQERMSRWGALDFDAHDGDAVRARRLALAALELLRGRAGLGLVLASSGSEGWHLFVFTEEYHPIGEWTRFLKQVALAIGAEIRPGCCEVFPNEPRGNSLPYGIRAPGTWNPKTNQLGLIFFNSIGALLSLIEREKEESPFLYPSTHGVKRGQLNDRGPFYSGGEADWQRLFAINYAGTRHDKLKDLVHAIYRQVSYRVARRNAEAQYQSAKHQPNATLAEHLEEFDELWTWTAARWQEELSQSEQERFAALNCEVERDLFRILLNFSSFAKIQGRVDFPISITNVSDRIGVSPQHISKLRQRFASEGIIAPTAPAISNRSAARFRWCLPIAEQGQPEDETSRALGDPLEPEPLAK